ncbi:hypothetical protein NMG60_11005138 [Bertholletia excelsa]
MEDEQRTSPSIKDKLRQTLRVSCCFGTNVRVENQDSPPPHYRQVHVRPPPSTLLRSRVHDLPGIRDNCRRLLLIGRCHRRRCSADFCYDPLSYALNFDDSGGSGPANEAPLPRIWSSIPETSPLSNEAAEADDLVNPSVPRKIVWL